MVMREMEVALVHPLYKLCATMPDGPQTYMSSQGDVTYINDAGVKLDTGGSVPRVRFGILP